jgi:dTDP-4-amino-4,6-dideoxy-D-galactose acyltransferase
VIVTLGVNVNENATFYELKWDTDFFGVSSAKAILHEPLSRDSWEEFKKRFYNYQFISIENKNSDSINAQWIGKDTTAFLADVNIQFEKEVGLPTAEPGNIKIHSEFKGNNEVLNIANYQFSKFTEDPDLAKRGGSQVYQQWIRNSFEDKKKFFAISTDENSNINGFLLHSYNEDACAIELIAVSPNNSKGGIGTNLFQAVENEVYNRGVKKIKVGTQVRNMGAINFYHKVGCKQIGCHQVYHLWNLL